jgi:cell volume regulation protein A
MPTEMLTTVTFFATLLGFGILVVNYTKKVNIPDALFMLLVGLILGPTVLNVVNVNQMGDVPDFLRILALIVIVFASAFHLKMDTFKRVSNISLKLAFGGFFFSTFMLALLAHSVFGLSALSSILLGTIIGGSSSAAIVTFRKALQEEKETMNILLVESIFTDPLSVLLPILILDAFLISPGIGSNLLVSQFWQMLAAGVGTGVIVGLASGHFLKKSERELSPTLSFAIALITYALAVNVGGSGILAVAICALILGNLNLPNKKIIGEFEDSLSVLLTISIFTLLGAQIALDISYTLLVKELFFVGLLIFVVRPLFTSMALWREKLKLSDKFLIAFTGPRGAASAAMAAIPLTYAVKEGLLDFIPEAKLILLTTFMVVLFTILSSTVVGTIFSKVYVKMRDKKKETKQKEEKQNPAAKQKIIREVLKEEF